MPLGKTPSEYNLHQACRLCALDFIPDIHAAIRLSDMLFACDEQAGQQAEGRQAGRQTDRQAGFCVSQSVGQ